MDGFPAIFYVEQYILLYNDSGGKREDGVRDQDFPLLY